MEETTVWLPLLLSFRSYIPKELEEGMLFLSVKDGEPFVYALEKVPLNQEEYISINGYPVEPYIVQLDEITDTEQVIVEPDEMAWMDEGEYVDEYVNVDVRHFNRILSAYEGVLELQMEEEDDEYVPVYLEDKVVMRYCEELEYEEGF